MVLYFFVARLLVMVLYCQLARSGGMVLPWTLTRWRHMGSLRKGDSFHLYGSLLSTGSLCQLGSLTSVD